MADFLPGIPADKPIEEIMDLILGQVGFPTKDANGKRILYQIIHKKSGRTLDPGLSFIEQGVTGNDQLAFRKVQGR